MTEKRFTIKEFSTLDAMSSLDVICDNGIELPSSTACDLLNELHEENQLFKIQLKKDQGMRLMYETTHNKLKNENEQLKSELKALRKKYNDFSDAVDKRLSEMDKRLLG